MQPGYMDGSLLTHYRFSSLPFTGYNHKLYVYAYDPFQELQNAEEPFISFFQDIWVTI